MANDPHTAAARAAMAQDQEDVTTRDQTAWELQVRSSEANAAQTLSTATYTNAKAEWWLAFARLLHAARAMAWLALAYAVVLLLLEMIR